MPRRKGRVGRFILKLLGFILLLVGLNFWSGAKGVTDTADKSTHQSLLQVARN